MGRNKHKKKEKSVEPFYPETLIPDDYELLPNGLEVLRFGKIVVRRLIKGADHQLFKESINKIGKEAEAEILQWAESVVSLISSSNAVRLLNHVVFFFHFQDHSEVDPKYFATRDSLIEYLSGLVLSLPEPTQGDVDPNDSLWVFQTLLHLPELIGKAYVSQRAEEERRGDSLDEVRFGLGLERLFDRMEGYVPHLERLYAAIFEPIRDQCKKILGFSPADIPSLVWSIIEEKAETMEAAHREAFAIWDMEDMAALKEGVSLLKRRAISSSLFLEEFCRNVEFLSVERIARRAEVAEEEFQKMLAALTCPWGRQPAFRSPFQVNAFRTHPILCVGGEFSAPMPWAILHEGFRWFEEFCNASAHSALLSKYRARRDTATEEVVRAELENIFGERLHGPIHYCDEGRWVECDAVVLLGTHVIIVECKAHGMTPKGRSGAPERVQTKIKELIEAPYSQAKRLASLLLSGGCDFKVGRSRKAVRIQRVSSVSIIAVSFERIDPLSHLVAEIVPGERLWSVCICDFLMVSEVLSRPSEFLAYTWLRSALAPNEKVRSFMEADLVSGFLMDRLEQINEFDREGQFRALLGYRSDPINNYFAERLFDSSATPPDTGIPSLVLDSLDAVIGEQDCNWEILVRNCFLQPVGSWKRVKQAVKKVKRSGTIRRLEFDEPPLVIEVAPQGGCSSAISDKPILRVLV